MPPGRLNERGTAVLRGVSLSHAGRVIDRESGTTRLGLARFYLEVAPCLLRQLAGRPFALVRAPDGVEGEQFFLRHPHTLTLPGLHRSPVEDGEVMAIQSAEALLGAVEMGSIEFHTGNADRHALDRPDRLVLDLEQGPLLPWSDLAAATRLALAEFDQLGLQAFIKTSGGKGIHLVVPLARQLGWVAVREFSRAVGEHLVRRHPRCFTLERDAAARIARIHIDDLRNQRGATTVAAYSVRARPGLPVSVPVRREELDQIDGAAAWTVRNLLSRLEAQEADPWAGYAHVQRITRTMKRKLGME